MIWPFSRRSKKGMARICIEGPINAETRKNVLKALKQIEEREFPALLLRIDSPGGTVGDSQEIHSALLRLREKGCHVIASFGNISASGGVYIGVGAEKIVANPGTITGSIGVILRGNNLSKLLEKVGVKFETVKSGIYKDILSPDRSLSNEERELLQSLIDSSYEQFVLAVAKGRNLTPDVVKSFADGRVFTGEQAKAFGLVDEIGDENDAKLLAIKIAKLDDKTKPITFGKTKKKFLGLLPGGKLINNLLNALNLEFGGNGQILWLYKP